MSESERAQSTSSQVPAGAGKPGAGGDQSMEDILASIRRILAEEEAAPPAGASPSAGDSVLQLDASMLVEEPQAAAPSPDATRQPDAAEAATIPADAAPPRSGAPALVAPEAAAAAASSVGSLVRTLMAERGTQVYSGGPTIEDIVRSELRPLLKQWLDSYLPPLVERLVRAEIERVVGRAVP
jgi:cell pole-organizing protein PopZ